MVRTYTQTARATAKDETKRAILDAAQALFREDFLAELTLEKVAERAGCSTRTVLRQFGTRDGLIEAAIADAEEEMVQARAAGAGDVPAAVSKLVDHYEQTGDEVMRWLAAAESHPDVRRITESGKDRHREWVEATFETDLSTVSGQERRAMLAALGSVTDLYLWELLRRRYGLSRKATEATILEFVEAARRRGRG